MSSNARLNRASHGESNMIGEMKTWRRNKMEDRKLALQYDEVDKHIASRRKSYQHDKISVNKEFEDKFSKKTPSADEYLEKSQAKYSTWKEREKERMDRRYRSLHRSYMNAVQNLGIENIDLPKEHRKSKSENPAESSSAVADTKKNNASIDNEVNEPMSEGDAVIALGKLNLDIRRRRFSDFNVGKKHPNSRRRGSTGTIDLTKFAKLRSMHLALTAVAEDTQDQEESEHDTVSVDKEDLNDITTRRNSVTIKVDSVEDIAVEDLIVRPKRRASIAAIPKHPLKGNPIPRGKRFDRRPTLPNIAIPFNYGN